MIFRKLSSFILSASFLYATETNIQYSENSRIVFFGASVTQQKEPGGYVGEFKKLHNPDLVHQFGYGGMQIVNAGICFIGEVLEKKPDILVLDWSLTGGGPKFEMAVKTVIQKAQNAGAHVFFIHFPRVDGITALAEKEIERLAPALNYSIFDLRTWFPPDLLREGLRDNCHTNAIGAKLYAEAIKAFLTSTELRLPKPIIERLPFDKIERYPVKKDVYNTLKFHLTGQLIGLYQGIGRFSNVISVQIEDSKECKHSIWDQWCHFERDTIKVSTEPVDSDITISVLNEEIDRHLCKFQVDWAQYKPKLVLHSIMYIGHISNVTVDE